MIQTSDFMRQCGCRSVGECTHNQLAEFMALDALVDAFAAAMKAKLRKKAFEGRSGWDDPSNYYGILTGMQQHASRAEANHAQFVDVANMAAMCWNFTVNPPLPPIHYSVD